jgi:tetratricopeptide (TPR) repeat protein
MKKQVMRGYASVFTILAFLFSWVGCATQTEDGKVPLTTSSDEARAHYLEGRSLSEKLRGKEAMEHFEQAVAKDPNFAMAHLSLALVQPTAKGFFESLNKAVAAADKVSEAEQWRIHGFEAGVNANPLKASEYYQKLVQAYPKDERAQFILGNNYNGQQEFAQAVEQYKKAIEIAPDFSPAYNSLGYAQRALENYTEAEEAFRKYTELIPNDPNPHDSYAELLMKMGRYDESIAEYKKALSIDPNFVASHVGIAANLMLKGKHDDARAELASCYDMARDDGERRTALSAMTVTYADELNMDMAVKELEKQYGMGEKINDAAAMAGDLISMGDVLYETGKYDEALDRYKKAAKLIEDSNLSQEIKDNTKLNHQYYVAAVAMKKKDFSTAKAESEKYRTGVKTLNNPNQIRRSHELAGMIAIHEKNYEKALEELQQANLQDPYNLYRIAIAYEGKGDKGKAKEYCEKAAKYNALPTLNYAFVRKKAEMLRGAL